MLEVVNTEQINSWLNQSLSYDQYRKMAEDLFNDGKTTGHSQTTENIEATLINLQRMQRLDKTAQLDKNLVITLERLNRDLVFLTLTEAWCGDAAQNLPWIHQLARASGGRILDRYILRDEHPDLMDQFLTDGSRSIPKLIILDAITHTILDTWGPRPKAIQAWFLPLRKQVLPEEKKALYTRLHKSYADDKGREFQNDMMEIMEKLVP